jgi:GNAT superfamily N-acetyltransferase
MAEIARDLSPSALTMAIEANQIAAFREFRRVPGVECDDGPEAMWFCTGVPFPLLNGVFRARLDPNQLDAAIEGLLERFKTRGLPMIWWTGPTTHPPDLGGRLVVHGLVHSGDDPGMAVDLSVVNEPPTPPGLTIEHVRDAGRLEAWLQPFTTGFEIPEFAARAIGSFFVTLGFTGGASWRHYVGWREGQPVACSSMFLGGGVAGIYNVATVPEARRQGLGAAMTVVPLRDALAMGYRIGILQSSKIGLGVYRRLGFQEYCTVGIYIWTGDQSGRDGRGDGAPGGLREV